MDNSEIVGRRYLEILAAEVKLALNFYILYKFFALKITQLFQFTSKVFCKKCRKLAEMTTTL